MIAVQSVGVFALDSLGVISLAPKDFPWLATIIGAFIFGFAIVLAGGCATGTIFRAGEGLVGSWFALIFYALFASITKTGVLAPASDALRSVTTEASTIHGVLGISPWFLVIALVTGVGLLVRYHLREGAKIGSIDAYPGYFTLDLQRGGEVVGMLSVSSSTGVVWYHAWHGAFVATED